jgi:hypothetical protein
MIINNSICVYSVIVSRFSFLFLIDYAIVYIVINLFRGLCNPVKFQDVLLSPWAFAPLMISPGNFINISRFNPKFNSHSLNCSSRDQIVL